MIIFSNDKCIKTIQKTFISFLFVLFISLSSFVSADDTQSTTAENENDKNSTEIYSNDAVLMDSQSNAILYEKNAHTKVYPASTTKILTAIIAIERLNISDTITASKNAIYSTPTGSSSSYIRVGEKMTVEELLYCLLLQSGNDAANVLAETISGSIKDFVTLMNEKAVEIGCTDSHFANAHGFHEEDHYSTPYDMVKIMQYAMKNDEFRRICETKSYVINETNLTKEKRYLKNTNKMLFDSTNSTSSVYYEYAVGGKTGYTEEARGTFIGYAKKNDSTIIVGTFDGSQNISGLEARFLDAITLYNYGFKNYTNGTIIDKNNFTFEVVDRNSSKKYSFALKDNVNALNDSNFYSVDYITNVDLVKLNSANSENPVIGTITFDVDSKNWNMANSYDLVLTGVKGYIDFQKIFNLLFKPILILILVVVLLIIYIKIRKEKYGDYSSSNDNSRKIKNLSKKKKMNYSSSFRRESNRNGYKNIRF